MVGVFTFERLATLEALATHEDTVYKGLKQTAAAAKTLKHALLPLAEDRREGDVARTGRRHREVEQVDTFGGGRGVALALAAACPSLGCPAAWSTSMRSGIDSLSSMPVDRPEHAA